MLVTSLSLSLVISAMLTYSIRLFVGNNVKVERMFVITPHFMLIFLFPFCARR
jgi:hypothetical protein